MTTTARTIPALLAEAAEHYADREALIDGDMTFTFTELATAVEQAALALLASGVAKGDRVAIWAPNCWEWAVVALATHQAGGVVLPINTRYKAAEAAFLLERAGAKLLFTVTDFLDTDYVELLRGGDNPPELPDLEQIVVLRGAPSRGATALIDFLATGASVEPATLAARTAEIGPNDPCHLMFTSGTTGKPKGVLLDHGPTVRGYDSWAEVVGLRPGDRYLVINPYFHSFGLNAGILACLLRGATNLPQATFDVPLVMQRIADDGITMLPGPPAIYQTILNHPDRASFDLSSLRLAVTGAAAIPVELIQRMRDELGFETVVTGYGLTEASGIATMCRHDDDARTIATTSGRAIPDVEVRIADDAGNEVPRGEPGEILVRGYNVMREYFDDPVATAEAVDSDGWLHTGDIGDMDERGYIRITDRKKDMFITGGFNAYPAEIEGLLAQHPDVGQVAVIGIPDERLGEVGMAFVVPRTGTTPDPVEIISWGREHMANFKAPRRVTIVDALPLNATGKVAKDDLRAQVASGDA